MILTNDPDGEVVIDFSFKFSRYLSDRLVKVIFCDGTDEFVLEGDIKVKREGTVVTILDVSVYCKGSRIRLSRKTSREFWSFLQMNAFGMSYREGYISDE